MMAALWLAVAYLTGSIPTSFVVAKYIAGVDLREKGSKNLGATNVYRVLGWSYAIPVGLIDVAKGAVPVIAYAPQIGSAQWWPLAVGVAAMLGHVFSVFLKFKGGKGVATAAGAVLALAPIPLLIAAGVWGVVLKLTGYVSLSSMIASASFPVFVFAFDSSDTLTMSVGATIALFIIFTHRVNIGRLIAGTENRFGNGRKGATG